MEQSKKDRKARAMVISSLVNISGCIIGSVLIGMILDEFIFNNNGLSIVISFLVGLLAVVYNFIRLLVLTREN